MDEQAISDLIQSKKTLWEESFKDIRVMLLTIGFPGSGSSLVGYLLTAHPSMVIADEPFVFEKGTLFEKNMNNINGIELVGEDCLYSAGINKIFNVILGLDYVRWLVAKARNSSTENKPTFPTLINKTKRYLLISEQHQGRFETLEIIGVKHSRSNVKCLSRDGVLKVFNERLEEKGIRLKFVLTVRNPFDMISLRAYKSMLYKKREGKDILEKNILKQSISYIAKLSMDNIKILKLIDPQNLFVSRHEKMVADPRLQLTKICEFLQVPPSPDYLDNCASCIHEKPHRRRFEFDWTSEQKQEVASLIAQYDFFSGYDWES